MLFRSKIRNNYFVFIGDDTEFFNFINKVIGKSYFLASKRYKYNFNNSVKVIVGREATLRVVQSLYFLDDSSYNNLFMDSEKLDLFMNSSISTVNVYYKLKEEQLRQFLKVAADSHFIQANTKNYTYI